MSNEPSPKAGMLRVLAFALGISSLGVTLIAFHYQDTDLWAKLAIGAHVWKFGTVPVSDFFAFTPVLPRYIEHEWGAGTIFFTVLKLFGPQGLMALKVILAFGAMFVAMAVGRRMGAGWNSLLLLAIPVAACLLLGYVPVVRSHAFTYCFFALALLLLEELRLGKVWPAFVLPVLMLVWSNIHGGFVAGLGTIAVYTAFAVFGVRLSGGSTGVPSVPPEGVTPNRVSASRLKTMVAVAIACGLVTLINIYGIEYWRYLVPALLHKRPQITEWQPLPLLGNDSFHALRILTAIVAIVLLVAWRRTEKRSWSGLVMLVLTALLAWRSRRHAPFFAVATMAFAGPFLETALRGFAASLPQKVQVRLRPSIGLVLLHGLVAIYVAFHFLPRASFTVLAPVGEVPVRETDILSRAQIEGNVATPFGWGGYCAWRLYPRIKVSLDSRYETTYPDSTFEMNSDFYAKSGTNWDRLVREYPVDFVILDILRGRLRPEDLRDHGYTLIWVTSTNSVLMSLEKHAAKLRQVAADLPPTTIDPVDAAIPDKWWLK